MPEPERPVRVGVLVPPENPTVEAELPALLPPGTQTCTMRLPVLPGSLEARLHGYNATLAASAAGFGGLELDALYLACTGSSYLAGLAGDADLARAIAVRPALSCWTAAGALRATLTALERRRLHVVSPYPEWLTERALSYWTACGLDVSDVTKVAAPSGIYGIQTADVVRTLDTLRPASTSAVVLSGTGMPTIDAIVQIGDRLGVPIISSSLAAGYHLSLATGTGDAGRAVDLVGRWL